MSRRDILLGTAASVALAGCAARQPFPGSYTPPPLDVGGDRSLRVQAAAHGLVAGFALSVFSLRNSDAYRRLAAEQCSIAVAENAMKWGTIRTGPAVFNFEEADAFVSFCEQHRIKMRGNNLCWHNDLPPWLLGYATPANGRALLVEHIRTVAGRYRGRMHSWDVVNEAVEIKDGRPDGLRTSLWLQLIGEDYIETAFRTAREADPAALLTYNEYGIEDQTHEDAQKRAATLLLLRRLRQRNVPIDAVGIQSHIKARPMYGYGPSVRAFITECRSMDLQVFVTELDVDDRALPAEPAQRDAGVAGAYAGYLQAVLAEPNVRAVLAWGLDDSQTWLNGHDARPDRDAFAPAATVEASPYRGSKKLYPEAALSWSGFSGGTESYAVWLERDCLLKFFADRGYTVTTAFEEPEHVNGPALALSAVR